MSRRSRTSGWAPSVRDGRYLEATDRALKKHGGLWFNDETFVISRRRN